MIFDKLFATRSLENPKTPLSAEGAYDELFSGGQSRTVNADTAMKLSAVYACVYVLSSAIAQLPLHVMRKDGKNIEPARDHPLFYLLHDSPNFWQTSYKMREYGQSAVLLHGNSFLHIVRSRNDETLSITPDDMIHVKALGTSLKMGKSVIQQHAETIGLGLNAKDFAGSFFLGNARPAGIVNVKTPLNEKAWESFKKFWDKASAERKVKKIKQCFYLVSLSIKRSRYRP